MSWIPLASLLEESLVYPRGIPGQHSLEVEVVTRSQLFSDTRPLTSQSVGPAKTGECREVSGKCPAPTSEHIGGQSWALSTGLDLMV